MTFVNLATHHVMKLIINEFGGTFSRSFPGRLIFDGGRKCDDGISTGDGGGNFLLMRGAKCEG